MIILYTVAEYAKKLKVSRIYVHQLIKEKKIVAKRIGTKCWLIIESK